jgi:hypothetical protein
MKRNLVASRVTVGLVSSALALTLANAQTQSGFVDVPPCHWAAEAINQVSGADRAQPESSALLAANALEQVFAGLQCENLNWSARFVAGAPETFAQTSSGAGGTLKGYKLDALETRVQGAQATVRYRLTVTLERSGATATATRSGTAQLQADPDTGWRVAYASLKAMNLPIFP